MGDRLTSTVTLAFTAAAVSAAISVHAASEENRIYYEPRCTEGNFGLPGLLHGRRVEERAFAEGRGPDPRTKDSVGGVQSVRDDPLQ